MPYAFLNCMPNQETQKALEPFIEKTLLEQLSFVGKKPNIICIGQGKNLKYLEAFNKKHDCFGSIELVPHSRWVMLYRRKEKEKHIEKYLEILQQSKGGV